MTPKKQVELPPHWVLDGYMKRCSVCGYSFPRDVKPSIDAAFADHLLKAHMPGQTSGDASQAATRKG